MFGLDLTAFILCEISNLHWKNGRMYKKNLHFVWRISGDDLVHQNRGVDEKNLKNSSHTN